MHAAGLQRRGVIGGQAVHAAPARANGEVFKRVEEAVECLLGRRLQDQREQAAIGAEIAPPQGMAGVAFKRRIQQAFNLRLRLQPLRDFQRGGALRAHAQVQGFQAAQHQKAIFRADLLAQNALRLAQHGVVVGIIQADAAHQYIGMAAEELGGGLHAEIHAVRQGLEPQRAGPGVVHHGQHAMAARHLGNRRNVGHFHRDGAGRFHADHAGGGPDQRLDLGANGGLVELDFHAHVGEPLLGKGLERAIAGRRHQQVIAAAHESHHHGHQRGRPRGRDHAVAGAFERRDALLQQSRRRRAGNAIAIAVGLALFAVDEVGERAEHHRGGALDSRRQAGEFSIRGVFSVHLNCFRHVGEISMTRSLDAQTNSLNN
ncbi:hypothetical protein D3C72_1236910 [compost metagenome]